MASTSPSPVVQTSRLLTIPGEIRNRIYKIVLSASTGQDGPTLVRTKTSTLASVAQWRQSQRHFLCLTQACRQLRTEFLPMHQKATNVCIDLVHLFDYLNHNVITGVNNLAELKGNITVRATSLKTVDLRGLILLCAKAPDLRVQFAGHLIRHPNFNKIFTAVKSHPKLFDYIAKKTDAVAPQLSPKCEMVGHRLVEVIPTVYQVDLFRVYVKRMYAEDWIINGFTRDFNSGTWAMNREEWSRNLGVSDIDELLLTPRVFP